MIFLDTETTGLLKPSEAELTLQPYLVEVYAVKLEKSEDGGFVFVDELETFVKPPILIHPDITKINNITNEMVAGAPTFAQLYPKLCEFFLGESTVVAHNVAFDLGVLYCELARLECEVKFPWPYIQQCTIELTFHLENKRQSLANLHKLLFGSAHENAHRARGDVEAMVRCYSELMQRGVL